MITDIATLVKWILVYALSGGFIHFVGTYLILVVLVRITGLVRVNVDIKRPSSKKTKKDKKESVDEQS